MGGEQPCMAAYKSRIHTRHDKVWTLIKNCRAVSTMRPYTDASSMPSKNATINFKSIAPSVSGNSLKYERLVPFVSHWSGWTGVLTVGRNTWSDAGAETSPGRPSRLRVFRSAHQRFIPDWTRGDVAEENPSANSHSLSVASFFAAHWRSCPRCDLNS